MTPFLKPPGLIVIDVQKGFDDPKWGRRNNPEAEQKIAEILGAWRKMKWPVFHVQHLSTFADSPLYPRSPGCDFKEIVQPIEGETVAQKRVNSAFIGTQLENELRRREISAIVVVGLTTPHCISTSVRMAGNLGFESYVVSDAVAAFELAGPNGRQFSAEEIHEVSLATLYGEFATVVNSRALFDAVALSDTVRIIK